jgi:hypothetical protein
MPNYEGGCLCGKVRFRVTAAAIESGYCHCRMCQKNTGAPVVAWVTFPVESFSWIGTTPGEYVSSARAQREFCRDCGSYLVFRVKGDAQISVNTASFDDASVFPPQMHIFSESRIPWFDTDDELPRHEGYGPMKTATD